MENNQTPKRRGRPPAFERAVVLERAAETFWRLGYEGASIADLTVAMGITAQSLYAAFGSKAGLYREALDWYGATLGSLTPEALAAPDAIATLGRLLRGEAACFTDPDRPAGCMVATAVLGCAVENDAVAAMVAGLRTATLARIRARLEQAQRDGELSADSDPAALARFVGTMMQGMSVQARDGATRAELAAVADLAAATLEQHRAPGR